MYVSVLLPGSITFFFLLEVVNESIAVIRDTWEFVFPFRSGITLFAKEK